ncbi:hypothetical protein [Microcoleus sp. D2_18a_D3]|uniref:hypothetical protein n=1 Tax=Microcoleus sp. D2_18a_D3 TaxID=3055330 RepID=UPI002FD3C1B7
MPPTLARDKSVEQLDEYRQRLGQDSGCLVICDRREQAGLISKVRQIFKPSIIV